MATYASVTDELNSIAAMLQQVIDTEDVGSMLQHLSELSAIGANMAQAEARAKVIADREMAVNLKQIRDTNIKQGTKMSPNELRDFAKAASGDAVGLYDMAQNLDRFLSKKIDSLRTMISLRKTEMEQLMHQTG